MTSCTETYEILPTRIAQDAPPESPSQVGDSESYSLAIWAVPSPELKEQIQKVSQTLQEVFPELQTTPQESLRLTIASLGTVTTKQQVELLEKDIRAATATVQPIQILVEGINYSDIGLGAEVFANDSFGDDDPLIRLHNQVANIAKGLRKQRFVPHIIMGHLNDPAPHKLYGHINSYYRSWRFGEGVIDRIYMTAKNTQSKSDQHPFEILAEYPLTGKEKWAA